MSQRAGMHARQSVASATEFDQIIFTTVSD
jgi:hypothetical protein